MFARYYGLVVFLALSTTRVCAEPSLKVTAERLGRMPGSWHSMKVSVRIQNTSDKPVLLKAPLIGMRVGDPWTTVDFLVERDGVQLRRRYMGMYLADMDAPAISLKPGEETKPYVYDLLTDESNSRRFWSEDGADTTDPKKKWARLPRGKYSVRIKFFSPVDSSKLGKDEWRGEATSAPIEFKVL